MINTLLLFKDRTYKTHPLRDNTPPEFVYILGFSAEFPPLRTVEGPTPTMRDYALREIKLKLCAEVKPALHMGGGPMYLYMEED